MLLTIKGYENLIFRYMFTCLLFIILQIFLVTGGSYSTTTEILQDKKWIVLPYGKLPLPGASLLAGLRLATIDNEVFAFGKVLKFAFNIYSFI